MTQDELPQFKIVHYQNVIGTISYRVTGWLDGKRIRKNFRDQDEAMTEKQNLERQAMNLVPLPTVTTRLTSEQVAEAESCFHRLTGKPMTLTQAVDYALRNFVPGTSVLVGSAYSSFISAKQLAKKRDATVTSLSARLKAFHEKYAKHPVKEIQADHVKPFIFREGSGDVNRDSDYRAFTNFFNWCIAQEYIEVSPMRKIAKIQIDSEGEPQTLPLDRVHRLIYAAENYKDGILVPYVVLCMFCGIRPDREASRLSWTEVKVQSKIIKIGEAIAKMRGRRVVEIPANALEFLTPHALRKTPIKGKNWRKDFDAVKLLAGYGSYWKKHKAFSRWPKDQPKPQCYCEACCKTSGIKLEEWEADVMRHTAITYHLAVNNEDVTAKWAGNSPEIIHNSYKALIEDKEHVEAFWKIKPGVKVPSNVVALADELAA